MVGPATSSPAAHAFGDESAGQGDLQTFRGNDVERLELPQTPTGGPGCGLGRGGCQTGVPAEAPSPRRSIFGVGEAEAGKSLPLRHSARLRRMLESVLCSLGASQAVRDPPLGEAIQIPRRVTTPRSRLRARLARLGWPRPRVLGPRTATRGPWPVARIAPRGTPSWTAVIDDLPTGAPQRRQIGSPR